MFDILFVDGDRSEYLRVAEYSMWESSNFRIKDYAKSSKQAIELMENYKYDLVIANMSIPDIDGLDITNYISEKRLDVKVILSCDSNNRLFAKQSLRYEIIDCIQKPYLEEELVRILSVVRDYLLIKRQQPEVLNYFNEEGLSEIYTKVLLGEQFKLDVNEYEQKMLNEEICKRFIAEFPWLNMLEVNLDKKSISDLIRIVNKYYLNNDLVKKVGGVIVKNISKDNISEIVAKSQYLNKEYLAKLFKRKTGISLREYILALKIECAKKLLITTSLKIYEISDKVGYYTVDYFAKIFKDHTEITPLKYRQNFIAQAYR